jgi:hypothetical protein
MRSRCVNRNNYNDAVYRLMRVAANLLDESINLYQRMAWKRGRFHRSLRKRGAGVSVGGPHKRLDL